MSGGQDGCCPKRHPPPRTRTTLQRPHRARRCPGLGWPSPLTLKPQPGPLEAPAELQQVPADRPLLATHPCSRAASASPATWEERSPGRVRRSVPWSASRWAWTGPAASSCWSYAPSLSPPVRLPEPFQVNPASDYPLASSTASVSTISTRAASPLTAPVGGPSLPPDDPASAPALALGNPFQSRPGPIASHSPPNRHPNGCPADSPPAQSASGTSCILP